MAGCSPGSSPVIARGPASCTPLSARSFGHGFGRCLLTILSAVFVDFLGVGCGVATAGWALSNRLLRRKSQHSHAVEQSVEWCAGGGWLEAGLGWAGLLWKERVEGAVADACGMPSLPLLLLLLEACRRPTQPPLSPRSAGCSTLPPPLPHPCPTQDVRL